MEDLDFECCEVQTAKGLWSPSLKSFSTTQNPSEKLKAKVDICDLHQI